MFCWSKTRSDTFHPLNIRQPPLKKDTLPSLEELKFSLYTLTTKNSWVVGTENYHKGNEKAGGLKVSNFSKDESANF